MILPEVPASNICMMIAPTTRPTVGITKGFRVVMRSCCLGAGGFVGSAVGKPIKGAGGKGVEGLSASVTAPKAFVAFCTPACNPAAAAELAWSAALANASLAFSVRPGARVVASSGTTGARVDTKFAASGDNVGMRLATASPIAGLIAGIGAIVGRTMGAIVGIGGGAGTAMA